MCFFFSIHLPVVCFKKTRGFFCQNPILRPADLETWHFQRAGEGRTLQITQIGCDFAGKTGRFVDFSILKHRIDRISTPKSSECTICGCASELSRTLEQELTHKPWGPNFHKLKGSKSHKKCFCSVARHFQHFPTLATVRGISLHRNLHHGADSSYHGLWLCQMLQGWLVCVWCLLGPWDAYRVWRIVADQRHSCRMILCITCAGVVSARYCDKFHKNDKKPIQPEISWWQVTLHFHHFHLTAHGGQFVCFTTIIWNLCSLMTLETPSSLESISTWWIPEKTSAHVLNRCQLADTFVPCLHLLYSFQAIFPPL